MLILYEGYYTSTELYGKLSGVSRSVSYDFTSFHLGTASYSRDTDSKFP